jgi:hypothetical protein
MLQQFLHAGMLPIGDADEKFAYLKAAAADVADRLIAAPGRTPAYTRAALDPQISLHDPIMEEAEEAVVVQWNTFRNRFEDRPRQLLRAVILEALRLAVSEVGPQMATLVWLSGASYLPYADLGQEREIFHAFFEKLGDDAEVAATAKWLGRKTEVTKLPTPLIKAPELISREVNVARLQKLFSAAAGPQDEQGGLGPGMDPNPHWSSSAPHWSYAFAPRAAKAIAGAVDPVIAALTKDLADHAGGTETLLRDHAKALRAALTTAMERVDQTVDAERKRTALLWWRQSLYSPSAGTGYRTLAFPLAALLMAIDLEAQTLANTPRSVEYLLRETVREVSLRDGRIPSVSVEAFCAGVLSGLRAMEHAPTLGTGEGEVPRRVSLLMYVRLWAAERSDLGETRDRLGVEGAEDIPLDDVAVWLFRDLQAESLAKEMESDDAPV